MKDVKVDRALEILHLEDSSIDHELMKHALDKSGVNWRSERVETIKSLENKLQSKKFDVVLADYLLPGFTAIEAWNAIKTNEAHPPFILLSGAIGEHAVVNAIKMGISDYLAKDEMHKLMQTILINIQYHNLKKEKKKSDEELVSSEKRLEKFSQQLQKTIEIERASISREIHDDIGGSLAAVKFDLAWIGRHTDDGKTKEHVNAAIEMLDHALQASQRIMKNLRPAILDQGLIPSIQWLAEGFRKRTGIKTVFHTFHLQATINRSIQLIAFRTAQEALTNISKHAECNEVNIDLSDADNVLTLEVKDNGVGIGKNDLKKKSSFGISSLHEQAKTIGGWIDVSTGISLGTSIILTVPLAPKIIDHMMGQRQ